MRLLLIGLFLVGQLSAQSSLFDSLYRSGDEIIVNLDTDWKRLMRKKKNKEYQPTRVAFANGDWQVAVAGKVRTRGHARLEACQYPSLKIKLKKDSLVAAGFSKLNDLKMVLQCTPRALGEDYLRREKLVYELHSIVSDYTHRTIPAKLIVSTGDTISAFFVEAEEQLAAHYGSRVLESDRVSARGLHRPSYVNLCLFNYMILNCDWNIFNLHNVEFINPDSTLDLIPIPYDFDYSGFVGTSYSMPHESLGIKTVYEPLFLGRNITEEELKPVAQYYLTRRAELTQKLDEFPDLPPAERKRLNRRLENFFKTIENEKSLLRLLKK